MKFAVKFAYVGSGFYGSQKQPGKRTVQGELEEVLGPVKLGSRTDTGVSALGAVCTFTADEMPNINQLNQALPYDLKLIDIQPVTGGFTPRHASSKTYQYFLPDTGLDLGILKKNAGKLVAPAGTNLKKISIKREQGFILMNFNGSHFGFHSIRKMVGDIIGTRKAAPAEGLLLVDVRYMGVQFRNNVKPVFLEEIRRAYFRKLQEVEVIKTLLSSLTTS